MLKLYYSPGACSLAVHIMLLERKLDFSLIKVNLMTHMTEDGVRLDTINPKNYVPVLVLDNDTILTEIVSIMFYLENNNPKDLEILCFISSELHKNFGAFFHKAPEEYKVIVKEKLKDRFTYIENILASKKYLTGNDFCAADAYLFTILRWLKFVDTGLSIDSWPAINNYYNTLSLRPTIIAALESEHIRA